MPGEAVKLGPFSGGLHNSSGDGEFITNEEVFVLENLEVDTDGSLANRPQINMFNVGGVVASNTDNWSFIGTYLPTDGRQFVVVYLPVLGEVRLIDLATNLISTIKATCKAVCCIQYNNKLWVVATPDSLTGGGYFDVPTISTVTFTAVASMPRGEAVALYRDRLFIAAGLSSLTDSSRCYFSQALDPSLDWSAAILAGFFDVAVGNGQKLVDLKRLGNDLVLFKEHSTHRFTYTTDPRKAELNEIDSTVGVPAINCVVVYNNNTIYCLHDNSVYELFQYTYTRISSNINMVQVTDIDLLTKDQYGLTLHRDRLFIRYFKNLYVYLLRVKKFCQWVTDRKFSNVVVIPSATVGLDTAYATTASQSHPGEAYWFRDVRITDDTGNSFPVAATRTGHNDYSSAGVRVATYNVATTGAVSGDWIYIIQENYWETADIVPVVPFGFVPLVPRQGFGVMGGGCEMFIWKKKWVTGDVNYTITLPTARYVRASAIVIHGGNDTSVVGQVSTPRGGVTPSVLTIPGIPAVEDQTLVLTFYANNPAVAATPPPTSVEGATYWFSVPVGASTNLINVSYAMYTTANSTSEVVVSLSTADRGSLGGVQIGIPPVISASDPSVERFQGKIITKTYNFDIPQTYKVIFWWGLSIATSGKVIASLNIPNASQNMTYKQARDKYGTWANAILAGQKWASNTPVQVTSTVLPSLGLYARKFFKLLKKVRFRQVYFIITCDVVTNGGIADATLRVYDATVLLKQKQVVVKEVS